ncbi:MAG: DNA gyrase inhibitor YacG [Hahellaceae bacterium]|nr:DNA gyrase inhibitor YacG [Hahellaceae bacterium]MCP5211257.1 DNA gyrase inhibitor YacG [Hahellaceae bacterium]
MTDLTKSTSPLSVDCPTCRVAVEWIEKNTFRPFCSQRCQLIDLGEWATESFRIPQAPSAAMDEYELEEMERLLADQEDGDSDHSNSEPHKGWIQ